LSEPSSFTFLVLSLLSIFLAFFSWKYVESVFRDKNILKRRTIFLTSCFLSASFVSLGVAGHLMNSAFEKHWVNRFPENEREFYSRFLSSTKKGVGDRQQILSDCRFNVTRLSDKFEGRIKQCEKKYGPGVMVLGDSHAIDLFGELTSRFSDEFLIGVTSGGCRPHTPRKDCQYDRVLSYVERNPASFKHIIYEQAGFYLLLDRNRKKGSRSMFFKLGYDEEVKNIAVDIEYIDSTLNYLVRLSKFVPVTWFSPRVEHHISSRFFLKKGCGFTYGLRPNLYQTFTDLDSAIFEAVNKRKNRKIRVVSQNGIFNFDFSVDFLNCEDLFWSDGDHFSSSGEVRFGARLPADFLQFKNE
jgi:hypothetical protein